MHKIYKSWSWTPTVLVELYQPNWVYWKSLVCLFVCVCCGVRVCVCLKRRQTTFGAHTPVVTEFFLASSNALSGSLPTELVNLMSLRALSLQSNNIDSTLPSFFGTITTLETLNFFNNSLRGAVPSQLGRLINLENLFLHFNDLTGTMPTFICALRGLNLMQLTADCGPRGKIDCLQPACCTACF